MKDYILRTWKLKLLGLVMILYGVLCGVLAGPNDLDNPSGLSTLFGIVLIFYPNKDES